MSDNQELQKVQENQDDKEKMLLIRLEPETHRKFKAVCASNNKSMTQCTGELIDTFLTENKLIV